MNLRVEAYVLPRLDEPVVDDLGKIVVDELKRKSRTVGGHRGSQNDEEQQPRTPLGAGEAHYGAKTHISQPCAPEPCRFAWHGFLPGVRSCGVCGLSGFSKLKA